MVMTLASWLAMYYQIDTTTIWWTLQ